ncbi:HupE/UreJ family protein [Streptomyces sp. NPDC051940]|uniref:HupE/UreJ family protein n=1 Tax=Streptomyces sp. NPDC051940 TaxID=3155675 RepID=UPI003440B3D2
MLRRLPVLLLTALLAVLFAGGPAAAHDATTTARVEVTGTGDGVTAVLDLEYDLLMKSAWLYAEAYEAKSRPEQLRQLRTNRDAVFTYVTERFAVTRGGEPCRPAQRGEADVRTRGAKSFAVLPLALDCGTSGAYEISSALFPDAETFVHGTRTIAAYDLDGRTGSAILTGADPTLRVSEHGRDDQVGEFFLLGAEHLFFGLDHLLFLLALLIGAHRLRDVVVTVSAFTAAHSITFLLAALGLVAVPGAVVEPVIAGSIIVVAVANLLGKGEDRLGRWRIPLVFAFGLVHGLGFAGALDIDGRASWTLLLSLLSFNVGIEATQLLIVAVLFPLLVLLRRTSVERWVAVALCAPIVAVSLYWFVERIAVPA